MVLGWGRCFNLSKSLSDSKFKNSLRDFGSFNGSEFSAISAVFKDDCPDRGVYADSGGGCCSASNPLLERQ